MTTTADRYAAYTDAELAQLWNAGSYAPAERDAIAHELERRGYRPTDATGAAEIVAVPESRHVDAPAPEPTAVAAPRAGYCRCALPLIDVAHDDGCRRCGLPVDFSPAAPADSDAAPEKRYTVTLSTTPDEDGHYRAEITTADDGVYVQTMYGSDRARLRERVAEYVTYLRSPKGPDEVYEL